jgi:hypothetical protein
MLNRAPSRAPDAPFHTDVIAVSWVRLGRRFEVADEGAATRLISLVSDSGLSGGSEAKT